MKFKKDGKVFEDIEDAREYFCSAISICDDCALRKIECDERCENNPKKYAKLMGFEIIEDEKGTDVPQDIGGMTLEQAKEYCIEKRKEATTFCGDSCKLFQFCVCNGISDGSVINWNLDRQRLTPEELEICRALGAKWVTLSERGLRVDLWAEKPIQCRDENGSIYFVCAGADNVAMVKKSAFQSVKPGDCISVEDLLQ